MPCHIYVNTAFIKKDHLFRTQFRKIVFPISSLLSYIGDDLYDVEAIKAVGWGCCPADGRPQAREAADYVTKAKGGEGVIREIADMILLKK